MTKPQDPIEPLTATWPPVAPHHDSACRNCGSVLQGSYCHVCGQHAHDPLKSFTHAVEDVFESFWHIDGRIFRTLRDLLVPGRIAVEYLAGKRVRYLPPLRLFVILSLITFFVAHFALPDSNTREAPRIQVQDFHSPDILAAQTVAQAEQRRDARLAELARDARGVQPGWTRDFLRRAQQTAAEDATRRIAALQAATAAGQPVPPPTTISEEERRRENTEGMTQLRRQHFHSPALPAFANRAIEAMRLRALDNLDRFSGNQRALLDAWIGAIPTTLFFLVPVFALLLRLFYFFTPWRYLEHLVVALYSHAFLLLGSLAAMLTALAARTLGHASLGESLAGWMVFAMMFYLLWTQKRVYRQGWPLTLLKFAVIGQVYSLMLALGAMLALGTVFLK